MQNKKAPVPLRNGRFAAFVWVRIARPICVLCPHLVGVNAHIDPPRNLIPRVIAKPVRRLVVAICTGND